jgi:outer membrane protein OmpA-like peptidoglycan-associated protein
VGLFAETRINRAIRHALLGGMILPAAAMAQAAIAADGLAAKASEGLIILAQAPTPDSSKPKGAPPKGAPPKGPQGAPGQHGAPGGAPPPRGVQNTPPAAPVQNQHPAPVQNQQHAVPVQNQHAAPAAPTPTNAQNSPPGSPAQNGRQLGAQPKGPQPVQGRQNAVPSQNTAPPAHLQGQRTAPGNTPAAIATPQNAIPPHQLGGQPGQPAVQGGRPAVAVQSGNVEQMRLQRHERTEPGGKVVIEEPGRTIVREGNTTIIRHDETERFRAWGGEPRIEHRGNEQFAYIGRPGGYQVITVTGPDGRLLRRIRRGPDGREIVLIDNGGPGIGVGVAAGVVGGFILGLAAPVITIPRDQYIVDVSAAPPATLYETLEAPPLVAIERPYSLDEIRYNVALRDRMRRIDIDSVTFDTGSWQVTPEQQPKLDVVAEAIRESLARSPDEVFLIEGHTDAVGNDVDNLSLSDHRAESVAAVLTEAFQIPPENLVTQGYGAQFLKIATDGPSRENRRVTVRRITPLMHGAVASR